MLKKFFAALAVMIFIFSATPTKTFATEFAGQIITATGVSEFPKSVNKNSSFYRSFARQAAKFDALSQIVEQVNFVQLDVEQTFDKDGKLVSEKLTTNSNCDEKFWVKYFSKIEIVDVKFKDSSCEMTLKAILK